MIQLNKILAGFITTLLEKLPSRAFNIEIDPPDVIIHLGNKLILNRILVCREVDYTPSELSWTTLKSRIESYLALMNTLPSDVHIYIVKEDIDVSRLIRRLSNQIVNIQSEIEFTPEESTRVKLRARLEKLSKLLDLLIKGHPFVRISLVLVYRVRASDKKIAKDMANYYESMIQTAFMNTFGLRLDRASRGEITSILMSMLGLSNRLDLNTLEVDGYKIATIQPMVLHRPPVLEKTVVIGWGKETLHPVEIAPDDLYKHMAIIGPTGRGKTTLLAGLIEQLVSEDLTRVLAIDFKGDLKRYIEKELVEIVSPREYAMNILVKPDAVDSADWKMIITESLAYAGNIPIDLVIEALLAIEEKNEKSLSDPRLSVLIPFTDLLRGDSRVEELTKKIAISNFIVDVEGYGIVFQNAYVSVLIGLVRYILLRSLSTSNPGVVLAIDDAWRVLGLRTISEIIREGRSRRLGVILSTQNPTDIDSNLLENIHHVILFGSRNGDYIDKVTRTFGLSESILTQLPRLDVGEAVYVNTVTRDTRIIKTYVPRTLRNVITATRPE